MYDDSGVRLAELKIDGGMANNKLFLQMLANIVGINVAIPGLFETTALGAAYFAGLQVGFWQDTVEIKYFYKRDRKFEPNDENYEGLCINLINIK